MSEMTRGLRHFSTYHEPAHIDLFVSSPGTGYPGFSMGLVMYQ